MATSGQMTSVSGDILRFEPPGERGLRAAVQLASERPFELGKVRVDPAIRQIVYADNSSETLEPRVMEVLVAMHRADGAILTRDDLTAACWHNIVVGEDAIQRVIQRLRKAAERSGRAFRIETITKVGYRLIIDGTVQSGVAAIADRPRPARRAMLASAVAALVIALATGLWLARGTGPSPVTVSLARFTAATPADQALAAGLSENFKLELATAKMAVQTGPTSFKLVGAVRKVDGHAEVALRLVDSATGTTVWSRTETADDASPPAERAAIGSLAQSVWCGIRGARNGPGVVDSDTVAMLLRHCDGNLGVRTPEAKLDNARRLALKEPRLWAANIALAEGVFTGLIEPADDELAMRREGLAAADAAIALIPDGSEGYLWKAMVTSPSRPIERDALFRKAIDNRFINCGCALQYYGDFLLQSGRASDALKMYQRGEDGAAISELRIFKAASLAGKDDIADAALAKLKAEGPRQLVDDALRFRAHRTGDYREVLARSTADKSGSPAAPAQLAVYRALVSGDPKHKAAALAELNRLPMSENRALVFIVEMLAALGDNDRAFAALELGRESGRPFSAPGIAPGAPNALLWGPSFAPLMRDPRFAGFLTRAGYITYWQGTRSRPDVCTGRADQPPFCSLLNRPV